MADWAAMRYSGDHIFDYIRLSQDHAIYETAIPDSWIGHTVVELAVRQKYGLNLLAVRRIICSTNPCPCPRGCSGPGRPSGSGRRSRYSRARAF